MWTFFLRVFPPENGQWFSQRRRNSSVPPSPGSFFLCFDFFSCLYRHSPISCLTGPFLSCPLHMRWCVIAHLLCPCQRALIPIFIIQGREAITAVEKWAQDKTPKEITGDLGQQVPGDPKKRCVNLSKCRHFLRWHSHLWDHLYEWSSSLSSGPLLLIQQHISHRTLLPLCSWDLTCFQDLWEEKNKIHLLIKSKSHWKEKVYVFGPVRECQSGLVL